MTMKKMSERRNDYEENEERNERKWNEINTKPQW